MAHDVLISYSSRNMGVAVAICSALEGKGVRCWIAHRDIPPGAQFYGSVYYAIKSAKVMVLVYSRDSNRSRMVEAEVEAAITTGIGIIVFRLEDIPYSKSLSYFLASCHQLDAMLPPLEERIKELCDAVCRLCPSGDEESMTQSRVRLAELLFSMPDEEPSAQTVLSQLRQDSAGKWCTVRKCDMGRDYLQTCKMCGWSDWLLPGLAPVKCCGDCGASEDPGNATRWFDFVKSAGSTYWYGHDERVDKVIVVRCQKCKRDTEYSFKNGPPFACPQCGYGGRFAERSPGRNQA